MSGRCKCIVCGRPFEYCDEWSPMLKNSVWKEVIRYYDLEDKERSNEELFNYYYDLYRKNKGTDIGEEYFEKCGDYSTFICYPCMERALGRELNMEDLITNDAPINWNFVHNVLRLRK